MYIHLCFCVKELSCIQESMNLCESMEADHNFQCSSSDIFLSCSFWDRPSHSSEILREHYAFLSAWHRNLTDTVHSLLFEL